MVCHCCRVADEIGFEALIDQLMAQFNVERSVCEADTQELLDQMLDKNIIRKLG